HSFYTDMTYGNHYWTFMTEELPEVVQTYFPLSARREANFVAGLSMGGYGAFKWALQRPGRFAAAASLSGVLVICSRAGRNGGEDPMSDAYELEFGNIEIPAESDLLHVVSQADRRTNPKPKLYQACGTEDALYQDNLSFEETCRKTNFDLTTHFGPGGHN